MTCEEFIIGYLSSELTETVIPVSGSVPHPMPDEFVTVEMTGMSKVNYIEKALISIECWSTSRAQASALNERVYDAMCRVSEQAEVSACALETIYNDTDMETNRPRYHSRYSIVNMS